MMGREVTPMFDGLPVRKVLIAIKADTTAEKKSDVEEHDVEEVEAENRQK